MPELYDEYGYDEDGYDRDGYDRDGYDRDGYDEDGYNRDGYDRDDYDENGYNEDGYNEEGYNEDGYDRDGYDVDGYNEDGYSHNGFDRHGERNPAHTDMPSGGLSSFRLSLTDPKTFSNYAPPEEEMPDGPAHCTIAIADTFHRINIFSSRTKVKDLTSEALLRHPDLPLPVIWTQYISGETHALCDNAPVIAYAEYRPV